MSLSGFVRLDKLLANLGLCSRRDALKWVRTHQVFVDGARVLSGALKVDPKKVTADGKDLAPFVQLYVSR